MISGPGTRRGPPKIKPAVLRKFKTLQVGISINANENGVMVLTENIANNTLRNMSPLRGLKTDEVSYLWHGDEESTKNGV